MPARIKDHEYIYHSIEVAKFCPPIVSFLQPSKADFHAEFDVVFVDPSGYLNLCAGMTTAQYKRVSELHLVKLVHCDLLFIRTVHLTLLIFFLIITS